MALFSGPTVPKPLKGSDIVFHFHFIQDFCTTHVFHFCSQGFHLSACTTLVCLFASDAYVTSSARKLHIISHSRKKYCSKPP